MKKDTNPKDLCGVKKWSMATLSGSVLALLSLAMSEGARKYGRFNWRRKKVLFSVYYDSTMRHLLACYEGQDIDPDSGLPHLIKAMSSLHVLMDAVINDLCVDDRPPRIANQSFMESLNSKMEVLAAKYPISVPPYTEKKLYEKTGIKSPIAKKVRILKGLYRR